MRILLWHVHGSWTTAFVQGGHDYLVPVLPDRGPDGLGRARTWDWPDSVHEVTPATAADADVDVVVLQRPEELDGLAESWLGGRRPGVDVPAIYLEHNAPAGPVNEHAPPGGRPRRHRRRARHALQRAVLGHGLDADRGDRARHRRPRLPLHRASWRAVAVVINEPVRRGRVTGTDLLPRLAGDRGPGRPVRDAGQRPPRRPSTTCPRTRLHAELARRRVYLHPIRWTSLGLSLIEAMHLGMPVVALATTEVAEAVPAGAGVVSNDPTCWPPALRELVRRPGRGRGARQGGPREAAWRRFGLGRFLADWDALLEDGDGMRIAMVSEHASPLAALGGVDAGGQNVHVAALATRARRAAATRSSSTPAATTRTLPRGCGSAPASSSTTSTPGRPRRAQGRAAAVHGRASPTSCTRSWSQRAARTSCTPTSGCRARPRWRPPGRWASRRADLPRPRRRSSAATRARTTPARRSGSGIERASSARATASSPPAATRCSSCVRLGRRASAASRRGPVRRRPRALPPRRPARARAPRRHAAASSSAGWSSARASAT